jgi:lipopolysaccharide exporter
MMRLALLGGFAQTGFNMLLYVLLVRSLPVSDMRSWVMYMTLTSFADMARHGLVYNGTIRRLTQPDASAPETTAAALVLSLLVSMAFALVFWISAPQLAVFFDAPLLLDLSKMYLLFAPLWAMLKCIEMVHIAKQNFSVSFYSAVAFGGLSCAILSGCWLTKLDFHLWQVVLWQSCSVLLALGILLVRFGLPNGMSRNWQTALRELFQFGKYSAGTTMFSNMFTKADVLIIGALLPGAAVVLYDAAARVYTVLDIPMNSASQVYYPQMTAALHQKDHKAAASIFAKAVAQLLILMVPLAIASVLFAQVLIRLLAGEAYTDASVLLQILCLGTIIKPVGRIGGIMLDAMGLPAANFVKLVLSALVTALLNYIGIKLFGLVGAAFASVLAVWVTILGAQMWIQTKIPINLVMVWNYLKAYLLSFIALPRLRNT